VAAIESGYMQQEIQEAAYAQQKAIDEGRRIVVGVNRYRQEDERPKMIFRTNPEAERAQIERLQRVRRERDEARVRAALRRLEEACRDSENLMPPILEAVKAYATLGEICGLMRRIFGEYRPPTVI
jgi:methylmalonyl-CoA mutase N-terminal domain/subunit